jgi:hypothetical protein
MKIGIFINGKKKNNLVKEHVGPMGEMEIMEVEEGGKVSCKIKLGGLLIIYFRIC